LDDAGQRRLALRSSRRRRAAARQGAGAGAPQGRARAALKGVGHEVPLARTLRKSAAAPWPCPPWTLATTGVWARMGFRGPTAGAGGLDLVSWAESGVGLQPAKARVNWDGELRGRQQTSSVGPIVATGQKWGK
jgi:hypothetical protein